MSKQGKGEVIVPREGTAVWVVMLVAALILVGLGLLIAYVLPRIAELYMGLVIVLAIGVLMVVLFAMAAGFARLNLSDRQQALGLPAGSVRAMIALFLIMVFIIFGIYLFRSVAGLSGPILPQQTTAQVAELGERVIWSQSSKTKPGTYDVMVRPDVTPAGVDLAQQLITTVGTLVVAVAGFYFGTRAVAVARGIGVPSLPVVSGIEPAEGEAGKEKVIKVFGVNLGSPAVVKLKQAGQADIVATKVQVVSDKQIQCTFDLKGQATGKWDLVVVNEDGGEDRVTETFEVLAASGSPSPVVPTVASIAPATGEVAQGKVEVKMKGTGFAKTPDAKVELRQTSQTPIAATDVKIVDDMHIECTVDLTGRATGKWDLVVINPDKKESTPIAFTVT